MLSSITCYATEIIKIFFAHFFFYTFFWRDNTHIPYYLLVHGAEVHVGVSGLAKLLEIFVEQVVENHEIVTYVHEVRPSVGVLDIVSFDNSLLVVYDLWVLEGLFDHPRTLGEVLGHRLEDRKPAVFDSANLARALLLHSHAKVIPILDAGYVELNPRFEGAQHFETIE